MDNDDGTYADDSLLTVFYQMLGVAPLVGVLLYEPALNEGVRAWLNDVWLDTSTLKRRWLTALYYYYGLLTGQPMMYTEVGEQLGVKAQTARQLCARGLRHLWLVTRTERATDSEKYEHLLQWALVANEWRTCDSSDNRSLEYYLNILQEDGTLWDRAKTSKTPTTTGYSQYHRLKERPRLWDKGYARQLWPDLDKTTVLFTRRGDLGVTRKIPVA